MPKLISRWFRRRDILVVMEEEEDEFRCTYSHSSHFSQYQYVQTEQEERFVLLSDANNQVLDWQSFRMTNCMMNSHFVFQTISLLWPRAMQFLLCDATNERMFMRGGVQRTTVMPSNGTIRPALTSGLFYEHILNGFRTLNSCDERSSCGSCQRSRAVHS